MQEVIDTGLFCVLFAWLGLIAPDLAIPAPITAILPTKYGNLLIQNKTALFRPKIALETISLVLLGFISLLN